MGISEDIKDMRRQGIEDARIIKSLKERGFSETQVNEALEQSKVKKASPGVMDMSQKGMQPSILPAEQGGGFGSQELQVPSPTPAEKKKPVVKSMTPSVKGEQKEQQSPYAGPQYPMAEQMEFAYPEQQQGFGIDSESIEEIAEEIVAEKFDELQTKLGNLMEWRSFVEAKISSLSDRVKRIEDSIDKLQSAVVGKVQDYSKEIKTLGGGMRSLEMSFSKVLDPLLQNISELKKITESMRKKQGVSKSKATKGKKKKISP